MSDYRPLTLRETPRCTWFKIILGSTWAPSGPGCSKVGSQESTWVEKARSYGLTINVETRQSQQWPAGRDRALELGWHLEGQVRIQSYGTCLTNLPNANASLIPHWYCISLGHLSRPLQQSLDWSSCFLLVVWPSQSSISASIATILWCKPDLATLTQWNISVVSHEW